jgi:hypothetical protein
LFSRFDRSGIRLKNLLLEVTSWEGRITLRYAKLTEEELQKIRKLESELKDICLLAVKKPPALAQLSDEQLTKVQALEKELGVRLVAYA